MADIDVVIPAHAKDFPVLEQAVRAALRHLSPVRHLHVVSAERFAARDPRVRWVPEPDLPGLPSLAAVRERWEQQAPGTSGRAAWVYQQLLKLGAPGYIDGLSDSYLVIDADVIFLRPVSFDPGAVGRFPYSHAYEYHPPYRAAFGRLFGAPPSAPLSLTVHHMLYDVALLAELRAELEARHERPWYWAYVDVGVDKAEASSISEMDIYGWWLLERHPELARHRQLVWRDVRVVPGMLGRALAAGDVDFVAAHAWFRQSRRERYGPLPARVAAELWARLRETARITR